MKPPDIIKKALEKSSAFLMRPRIAAHLLR